MYQKRKVSISRMTENTKFCKRVVEYPIKENNNTKTVRRYHTTRKQLKHWRDEYDGIVKLKYISQ